MATEEKFVNELTAEAMTPAEFVASLRVMERAVQRLDDTIASLRAELKAAKQGRDRAVSDMRSAIREIKELEKARRKSARPVAGKAGK
jgi:hypothetical protein